MFTKEYKQSSAAWPRGQGSALQASDKLAIAYIKYSNTASPLPGQMLVNLIFAHGTGMNKSVWRHHIEQLYKRNSNSKWHLDKVLAIDCASHGDSALLNKGKLAWGFDWRDGGKDLIHVVKHEAETTGDFRPDPKSKNILVGHSFGGFHCSYAAFLEPLLFSGCIAIEPVLFVDTQFKELFFMRLQKVHKAIADTFDLMEDAVKYFQKASFYRTLEPAVLKDYVADELYAENGKIKCKASIPAQMATYGSAFFALDCDQEILKFIRVPYLHIVGTEAAWNLPQTVDFVKESIPEALLETKEIRGSHLMFGENVQDTLDAIEQFCNKWVNFAETHISEIPEVKYDRAEIMSKMYPLILEGKYNETFWYGRPNPKM